MNKLIKHIIEWPTLPFAKNLTFPLSEPWLSVLVWWGAWWVWCSRGRHGEVLRLDVLLPVCCGDVTCKLSIAPSLQNEIISILFNYKQILTSNYEFFEKNLHFRCDSGGLKIRMTYFQIRLPFFKATSHGESRVIYGDEISAWIYNPICFSIKIKQIFCQYLVSIYLTKCECCFTHWLKFQI